MAKNSGLGQALFVQGYDLSTDASALDGAGYNQEMLDTTGIDKSATERVAGRLESTITVNGFFDNADDKAHEAYTVSNKLPTGDRAVTYLLGTAISEPALFLNAKQASYDVINAPGNALATTAMFSSTASVSGFDGVAFGVMLDVPTTYTSTTNGTTVDQSASSAAGSVACLQFISGSSVSSLVAKIQHSSDGGSWSDIITFSTISANTPTAEILSMEGTVNRYVRVQYTLSGTNAKCQMSFHRK
jgi:hypothetical protein|tara:strand:- start:1310 stop:2044 length:735 start_codon:yes stop_codon:yes gene_type:complete